MTVADLQQHLADLGRLLESSGAKAVATDLGAIRDGLAPFRDQPLASFANFLVRAEAFSRGEVPLVAPKGGRPAPKLQQAKPPAAGVEPLAREAEDLYERAASPDITPERIESFATRIGSLSKDGLVIVAERIGLKGMKAKAKAEIQAGIRRRIIDRKGSSIRASMLDHQPASSN